MYFDFATKMQIYSAFERSQRDRESLAVANN